jgi:multimeric flavodoxin WrbA
MEVLVLMASPNLDGLTAACARAAGEGVQAAGGQVEEIRLTDHEIARCGLCSGGRGTCSSEHTCQVQDDFQALHTRVRQADGLVIVTPVYWGEPSEAAKALLDRLRRCEAPREAGSSFSGKPVLAVAAAGESGNGMVACLASLERWIDHVRGRKFDLIGVNRWSRAYKLVAIRSAGQALVEQTTGGR